MSINSDEDKSKISFNANVNANANEIVCCECLKEYSRVELFLCHWRNYHQNISFPSAFTKTNPNNVDEKIIQNNVPPSNILKRRRKYTNNTGIVTEHRCTECSKYFSSKGGLISHWKQVHRKLQMPDNLKPISIRLLMIAFNANKCLRCKLSFKTRFSIQRHFMEKHSKNIYICPECNRGILCESNIKKHWLNMHKDKPLPGQAQDSSNRSSGTSSPETEKHIETRSRKSTINGNVTNEEQNQNTSASLNLNSCSICDTKMKTNFAALRHYMEVHSIELIICPEGCGGFRNCSDLIAHWFVMHKNSPLPDGDTFHTAMPKKIGTVESVSEEVSVDKLSESHLNDQMKSEIISNEKTINASNLNDKPIPVSNGDLLCVICEAKYKLNRKDHLKSHWLRHHKTVPLPWYLLGTRDNPVRIPRDVLGMK